MANTSPIVFVVDPKALRRASYVSYLADWASANEFAIMPCALQDAISKLRSDHDCRMLILSLGGETITDRENYANIKMLQALAPKVPIVILSDRDEFQNVAAALLAGARGYIPTSIAPEIATLVLQFVQDGGTYVPASFVQRLVTRLGDATKDNGNNNNPDVSGGGNETADEDDTSSLGRSIVAYRWYRHRVKVSLPGISAQSVANGRKVTHASQTSSAAVESEMASSARDQIVGHGTGDIVNNGASATLASAAGPAEQPEETEMETIPTLSPRQHTILRHLIVGDSNKSIARKVSLSEATVKVHVKTILRKIRVHNRTQAAIWALNHSLDEIDQELFSTGRFKAPLCDTKY
jgi:DNA-binding NarL/FixJ family response regulator